MCATKLYSNYSFFSKTKSFYSKLKVVGVCRPGHCGNTAIATRLFLRLRGFFKKAWHFKNIFREFEDIFREFEDIFREVEAIFN
jgi:hypothetical protein